MVKGILNDFRNRRAELDDGGPLRRTLNFAFQNDPDEDLTWVLKDLPPVDTAANGSRWQVGIDCSNGLTTRHRPTRGVSGADAAVGDRARTPSSTLDYWDRTGLVGLTNRRSDAVVRSEMPTKSETEYDRSLALRPAVRVSSCFEKHWRSFTGVAIPWPIPTSFRTALTSWFIVDGEAAVSLVAVVSSGGVRVPPLS
jgi:hypothetical protein